MTFHTYRQHRTVEAAELQAPYAVQGYDREQTGGPGDFLVREVGNEDRKTWRVVPRDEFHATHEEWGEPYDPEAEFGAQEEPVDLHAGTEPSLAEDVATAGGMTLDGEGVPYGEDYRHDDGGEDDDATPF